MIDERQEDPRRRRRVSHRWWWLAVPVGLVVVGAAVAVVALRDPADPVSVDRVVDRYRQAAGADPAASAVPPGVYRYRTTGSEGVDALNGSTHRYPSPTTVTVKDGGGGCVSTRWDALAQRWDEAELCPSPDGDGWSRPSITLFHSFFNQDETRAYTCQGAGYVPPPGARSGTATWTCASKGSEHSGPTAQAGERRVVGTGTVRVAGVARPALHVRYTVTVSGATTGTATLDRWYALERFPLVVRETYHETTSSGTRIGVVHYHEDRSLSLAAWEPQR